MRYEVVRGLIKPNTTALFPKDKSLPVISGSENIRRKTLTQSMRAGHRVRVSALVFLHDGIRTIFNRGRRC